MKNVMMVKHMKQQGVALIQVLLLSAILGLMALQFTLSSRQQVSIANDFKDKIAAEVELRTSLNQVLLALLTVPTNEWNTEMQNNNPITSKWSFNGQLFEIKPDVFVSIQDLNGLISLYGQRQSVQLFNLLKSLGYTDASSRVIVDDLAFWQGLTKGQGTTLLNESVRSNYFINKAELKFILKGDVELYHQLSPLVTTYPTTYFNPLTAPSLVLKSMLNEDVFNEIEILRKAGKLTSTRYLELNPGFDDDTLILVPGRRFEVTVNVKKGHAVAKRTLIWYIRPQSKVPVVWLQ
jgi:general secretion pathway protein K